MGVYDCIKFECPSCGTTMIAQSKSGPCTLETFNSRDVPVDVACDANRHAPFKCVCGKKWIFVESQPQRISLYIVEYNSDQEYYGI